MEVNNYTIAMVGVILLGAITIIGTIARMKQGIELKTIRFVGAILVAVFAVVLGLADVTKMEAPVGILGTIVGYLIGVGIKSEQSE